MRAIGGRSEEICGSWFQELRVGEKSIAWREAFSDMNFESSPSR